MQKKCKYCGKEFDATKSKRLYCSDKCKKSRWREKDKKRKYGVHMENPNAAVVDSGKGKGSRYDIRTVCSKDGRHGSCGKTQKNIKESLQQQKQISRDYSLRNIYHVNFADMRHKWMYHVRRAIKNGADSMQFGKAISS